MRDESIYNMKSGLDHKVAILYQQVNFLNMRVTAYETVLKTPWRMIQAVFAPHLIQEMVNQEQMKLIKKHDQEVMERVKKVKEESAKPKIQVISANGMPKLALIIMALFISGCISPKYHKSKVKESYSAGYAQANKECIDLQTKLGSYVTSLQERLRKFNQLNEDGSLRTKDRNDRKGWKGDTDKKEIDGTESWQK